MRLGAPAFLWALAAALLLGGGGGGVLAAESSTQSDTLTVERIDTVGVHEQQSVVQGAMQQYEARLERVVLDYHGHDAATVLLTSYMRPGIVEHSRPVIFAFNGGPGSASAWLQLGLLGPRVFKFPSVSAVVPTDLGGLQDNDKFLIPDADIVFVDPVGTGFSTLNRPDAAVPAWSSDGDAEYIAGIVRAWRQLHHREASPMIMIGESYGAQRIVDVAYRLSCMAGEADCHPQGVDGLVLVSQSLALADTNQRPNNDMGLALGLPTLAALNWYHDPEVQSRRSLEQTERDAMDFVDNSYLAALFKADMLAVDQRRDVIGRLSDLTGLSADYIARHQLRISKRDFLKDRLAAQGQAMDPDDGRYTAARLPTGPQPEAFSNDFDPIVGEAARKLVIDEFGYGKGQTYVLSSDVVSDAWVYADHASYNTPFDYPGELNQLMARYPSLRVIVSGGYFDSKGTFGADEFLRRHLHPREGQLEMLHYLGGHKFYTVPDSFERFTKELRDLVTAPPLH